MPATPWLSWGRPRRVLAEILIRQPPQELPQLLLAHKLQDPGQPLLNSISHLCCIILLCYTEYVSCTQWDLEGLWDVHWGEWVMKGSDRQDQTSLVPTTSQCNTSTWVILVTWRLNSYLAFRIHFCKPQGICQQMMLGEGM